MYQQRITADQLARHYRDSATALAAGDFFTALRLNRGDPEIEGICRVMLGNEVAGTATLDGLAAPTPRALLFSALGHWLIGRDEMARERIASVPSGLARAALLAAMQASRPRIAFFSGNEKLTGFVAAVREAGVADLVTIGHRPDLVDVPITPATDPAALVAAVGQIDALYIDNLTILPSQLAAIRAPRICQVYDVEHSFSARGPEANWIDWLVAGTSGEHFEAGLGAERPLLLRGIGLTELWPDLSGLRNLATSAVAPRPIDILFTGGIDMPFYPDKQIRLAELAQIDESLHVEIHGRMLDKADYFARLGRAKFVFSSTRSTNSTPKRLIESLSHGALLLCEQDSSLELLFDCDGAIAKRYGNATLLRDVKAHARAYPEYVARLAADRSIAERLLVQLPSTDGAVRSFVRYVGLLTALSHAGLTWCDLLGQGQAQTSARRAWSGGPGPYAAKHSDMQAYQPALRRTLFAPLAQGADVPLTERMVALSSLAICDRQEHLLRRQPLGRKLAAPALMRVLNRARRDHPDSLTVWVQLAELLVDVGRLRLAARVLTAIRSAGPRLTFDVHPTLVTPAFEYQDFSLVDGLIRERLHDRDPDVFPVQPDLARERIAQRLLWLHARAAQQAGDLVGLGSALDTLLSLKSQDPWLLEQSMMMAASGARSDHAERFLERLCRFYLAGASLNPRFLNLHFPLALQAMVLIDRGRLAQLMIRRFLRAKARVHLMAGDMPTTDAERSMLQTFRPAIVAGIGRLQGSPVQEPLSRWLARAAA